MTENLADFLPIWMILSAAFGFIIGDAFGDNSRHRKCLQEANEELRDRLRETTINTGPTLTQLHAIVHKSAASSQGAYRLLKEQRRTLRALSEYILPVTKGGEKAAS